MTYTMNYKKLVDIAEDDHDFLILITKENINLLKDLKINYRAVIQSGDVAQLKFLIHKVSNTLNLLELTKLEMELNQGTAILSKASFWADELSENIEKVAALCDEMSLKLQVEIDKLGQKSGQ